MINGLKIKILVLIVEKILINFYTNNKNKMGVLNPQDKFIVWSLINFYEFSLGFLLGLVLTLIFGIGKSQSKSICRYLGYNYDSRLSSFSSNASFALLRHSFS